VGNIKGMITKYDLEEFRTKEIDEVEDIEALTDITSIDIDTEQSVTYKMLEFLTKVKNPYLFRVGNTPVKIMFADAGNTLQSSVEKLLTGSVQNI
jgi:hypothetical protein